MNRFQDHLLPLYLNRDLCAYEDTDSPSPQAVGVEYVSSVAKYEAIVRIVNTVREVGLEDLITALCRLFTPLTVIYDTVKTYDVSQFLTGMGTEYCLVWMKANELTFIDVPGAEYAIAFTIDIAYPYQAIGLAYLLLRFSEKYTLHGKDDFKMVNLCYKLTPEGVYGALFYDANMATIHHSVKRCARQRQDESLGLYRDRAHKIFPVEIWNVPFHHFSSHKNARDYVTESLTKIRELATLLA
ncbi:hypothetical protein EST38_g6964 [Candolleomyces aberdarensis]|uniref:Uncharacterized protein n=1 Tax=Candolleomyces aberdarensis TaxID=2316362 RepID=A0A4Q2DIG1_9AGAR|nr:hypothetical protein EST38_g6964 [Candolleomyces aberdarensis]